MKKKYLGIILVAALALVSKHWLYPKPELPEASPISTRSITDMKQRCFRVQDPLDRIGLLGGPTGQVAFILGIQDRLCAVTNTLRMSKLVQEIYPPISDLPGPRTTAGNINIEELIQSRPQIVVTGDIDGSIVLEKTRIPVAFLDDSMGEGVKDIKREIQFYGYLFRAEDRARAYTEFLDKILALVLDRTGNIPDNKRKTVFQGYSPSRLVTLGGDTFMQERIEMAGCLNAAKSVTTIGKRTGLHLGLGEVSMEQVLDWNPDILIINFGSPQDVYADPQWRHIRAVREKHIHAQPARIFIFNRPTAESAVIFPLWLASIAYPKRFQDVDLPGIVKQFYREIMDFQLSDQQAEDILKGHYEFKMMKGIKHGQ
ncbi:MAG: ABC transporter substrate-binding protein [Desulfobacter sp.]|nr:ABC transporter substrate-binding protein [Desulfobacter sp.]